MAKISLRAYIREIDNLIEKDQIEEAVAHCKYILKFFPKQVDTYRLLGKAFLEDQRHSEALDIFQRVLSVIPDDFISQIGMSLIREDENNLDAAIWHMERAFEVQPSTTTIQEELRRLYTRRDGMAPPKTRLTKGALIRMYIRGELYTQAISEIKAVLAEDPLRTDLELLLGRTYFQTGQKDKALDVCSRIVEKMPYCLEADLILTDVLISQGKTESAKIFQQRLQAIDPYYAYINTSAPTTPLVPDNAIMLERLEWQPSLSETVKPGWASTIGIEIEKDNEAIPDWLITEAVGENAPPTVQEPEIDSRDHIQTVEPVFPKPEEGTPTTSVEVIPDWLASAGWKQSTDHVEETIYETEEDSKGPVKADIPDWLLEIEPQEKEPTSEVKEDMIRPTVPDNFQPSEPLESQPSPRKGDTQPIKISERTSSDSPPAPTSKEIEVDLAWLESLAERQGVDQSTLLTTQEQRKAAVENQSSVPITEETQDVELPARLEGGDIDQSVDAGQLGTDPTSQTIVSQTSPTEAIPNSDLDSSFAWLEALAARQGADEGTLLTKPEDRKEDTPDWLMPTEVPIETTPESVLPGVKQEGSADDELPEWLMPVEDQPQPRIVSSQPETIAESPLPDWLISEVPAEAPTEANNPETVEQTALPEWLQQTGTEQGTADETIKTGVIKDQVPPPESFEQVVIPEDISPDFTKLELSEKTSLPEGHQEVDTPVKTITPFEPVESAQTITEKVLHPFEFNPDATDYKEKAKTDELLPEWLSDVGSSADDALKVETEVVPTPPLPTWLEEIQEGAPSLQENPVDSRDNSVNETTEETIKTTPFLVEASPPVSEEVEKPILPDWLQDIHDENPVYTEQPISEEITYKPELTPVVSEQTVEDRSHLAIQTEQDAESVTGWIYDTEINADVIELPIPVMPVDLLDAPEVVPVTSQEGASLIPQAESISLSQGGLDVPRYQQVKIELSKGNLKKALSHYALLINSGQSSQEMIFDLEEATHHYPVDIDLWQTLGDAYAKADRIQEALDAYTKAEDLLD